MTARDEERAKNILYKWGNSSLLIEYEKEEIERIEEIIESMTDISASVYSHLPKSRMEIPSVDNKIIRSVKMCEKRLERINKRVAEFMYMENVVNDIVDSLDFDKQYVIKSKYYKRQNWDEICGNYPYDMSMRNFYRIHKLAVEEFYIKYREFEKSEKLK
ncbi:MAG: hypothetical protein ACI4VF_00195 [Lachnospirales bacterium]